MPTLLVIDDEPTILQAFQEIFDDPGIRVRVAETGRDGLHLVDTLHPDAVVLDLNLPDVSGLDLFETIRTKNPRVPVLFITGHGTTESAIEAMKRGALDYLLKPLELSEIRALVAKAFEVSRLMQVPALVEGEPASPSSDVLVGRCPAIQNVYKTIGKVAATDVTVLITGESGTGKELVARALYQHSRRAQQPFLAINCAAIPENLLESELFGHEKGAFTGADRKRIGKFEQVSGGTLFLDEIGDMSPLTQTKILRVLQDGRFERVGGNETIQSNVRILAATNRDLEELVRQGRFRSDLFYRLNVVTIPLPPLRERGEDLTLLVNHFLRRFAGELDRPPVQPHPDTMKALARHAWPGNVRELQSVLKQAILHATGPVLLPATLPAYLTSPAKLALGADDDLDRLVDSHIGSGSSTLYEDWFSQMEKRLLTKVLQRTEGNQVQAARILGISRNNLRAKIKNLGIVIERNVSSKEEEEE